MPSALREQEPLLHEFSVPEPSSPQEPGLWEEDFPSVPSSRFRKVRRKPPAQSSSSALPCSLSCSFRLRASPFSRLHRIREIDGNFLTKFSRRQDRPSPLCGAQLPLCRFSPSTQVPSGQSPRRSGSSPPTRRFRSRRPRLHRHLLRRRMAISGGKAKPPISAMPVGGCFILRYSLTGS